MTFSLSLQRHIDVPIEQRNRFDQAELESAISHLPNWPESTPEEIRRAAKQGDLNARLVVSTAKGDGELADLARSWL